MKSLYSLTLPLATVTRGALKEAWRAKIAILGPGAETWSFVWTNPDLKDLQRKLEEGPLADGDTAESLVDAAFTAYLSV